MGVRWVRGGGEVNTLPWDYSRCVGQTNWASKELGEPDRMHSTCNGCRRREPGHPERQVYLAAAIDKQTGQCPHRIAPEAA